MILYTWDERKADRNLREHRVSFSLAEAALLQGEVVPVEEQFRGGNGAAHLWCGLRVSSSRSSLGTAGKSKMSKSKNPIVQQTSSQKSSASSRRAKRPDASVSSSIRRAAPQAEVSLSAEDEAILARLVDMPDSSIRVDLIPEVTVRSFTNQSGIASFFRPLKQQVTLRLDADVLAWARQGGRGYQTRLNSVLRGAMLRDHAANQARKGRAKAS